MIVPPLSLIAKAVVCSGLHPIVRSFLICLMVRPIMFAPSARACVIEGYKKFTGVRSCRQVYNRIDWQIFGALTNPEGGVGGGWLICPPYRARRAIACLPSATSRGQIDFYFENDSLKFAWQMKVWVRLCLRC